MDTKGKGSVIRCEYDQDPDPKRPEYSDPNPFRHGR